ncbi:hypothetical protein N7452_011352 [Penicillium brevicompactum]|uniref:Uncharacterized protein n=1 Tax=Penicillium brevicompactum TaxID=5074 RepID=A0A9W9Q3W3_PENBR|nr:hypothetical protein N7452_011352 [Penicillium brevicompactum]
MVGGDGAPALRLAAVGTNLRNPVCDWHDTEGKWTMPRLAKATRSIVDFDAGKAFNAFDTLETC